MPAEKAQISENGRIVIPAAYRKAMELKPGDILQVSMDEHGIHLSSKGLALRRAQDMVCKYIATDVSLADELIAERRAEAKHEQAG